jgi:hypothetical protein
MNPRETARVQEALSKNYALKVLGKSFVQEVFKGDTAGVHIAEMGQDDSATDGDFIRLERGTILTTVEPERMKTSESVAGLVKRLNLVDIPRARRCDLGTIIERAVAIPGEQGERSELEWAGAGIDLLDETQARFWKERKSPEYKALTGRSILFPGILVGAQVNGPHLVILDLEPEGPQTRNWQFMQCDYDMEEGELLVARGQVAKKKGGRKY